MSERECRVLALFRPFRGCAPMHTPPGPFRPFHPFRPRLAATPTCGGSRAYRCCRMPSRPRRKRVSPATWRRPQGGCGRSSTRSGAHDQMHPQGGLRGLGARRRHRTAQRLRARRDHRPYRLVRARGRGGTRDQRSHAPDMADPRPGALRSDWRHRVVQPGRAPRMGQEALRRPQGG